jgi:hypothetical protein
VDAAQHIERSVNALERADEVGSPGREDLTQTAIAHALVALAIQNQDQE